MKFLRKTSLLFIGIFLFASCGKKSADLDRVRVEMVTTQGTMVLELYNETPKHRDNFIKVAKDGLYDSLLFHRVIKEFMIQGGDPESKNASLNVPLGNGDLGYTIEAEFNKNVFHKKGVLAAARDGNLERASSAIQFYIVEGKVFTDSLLDDANDRINEWLAQHYFKQDPANKALVDSLQLATDRRDAIKYGYFNDRINELAKDFSDFEKHTISDEQREVYKTIGGAPHLDQNYTAYGEVVEGLEVIDKISSVRTNRQSRPFEDIQILSVKILED